MKEIRLLVLFSVLFAALPGSSQVSYCEEVEPAIRLIFSDKKLKKKLVSQLHMQKKIAKQFLKDTIPCFTQDTSKSFRLDRLNKLAAAAAKEGSEKMDRKKDTVLVLKSFCKNNGGQGSIFCLRLYSKAGDYYFVDFGFVSSCTNRLMSLHFLMINIKLADGKKPVYYIGSVHQEDCLMVLD